MANTVSPAWAQLSLTCQSSLADLIPEYYRATSFHVELCPSTIFADVIRINALRAQAASRGVATGTASDTGELLPEVTFTTFREKARKLIHRILSFDAHAWYNCNEENISPSSTSSSSSNDDYDVKQMWMLLGRLYQSAVTLYCISSFRALDLLPQPGRCDAYGEDVEPSRTWYRERLVADLREALDIPGLRLWLMWPLVVAGMDTGAGPEQKEARAFVLGELEKMAVSLGTPLPFVAKDALHKFWKRGGGSWDDCFDGPYAFVA